MSTELLIEDVMGSILDHFVDIYGREVLRDEAPYTRQPAQNLLAHIPHEVLDDFHRGDGGELRGTLPKFCAVHSSSALAANCFGPFRHAPRQLAINGLSGFDEAVFEGKLSTGISRPNLDLLATGPGLILALESKFTEMLVPKTAAFSDRYDDVVDSHAESAWASLYGSLRQGTASFVFLDVAQLVKHYLGVRRYVAREGGRAQLLYLYWEPTNASDLRQFVVHRQEVADFERVVARSEVSFRAITYPDLWREWDRALSWAGVREHVAALRTRYELAVVPGRGGSK